MATPLDITALQPFEGVFPFLFIMLVTYAALSMTDYFKDHKGMAAIISLMAAFMTLFSPIVMRTVQVSMPWFVLFLLFMVFFILAFMATGVDQKFISKFVKDGEFAVGIWMLSILIIIFLGSFLYVWSEETGGPAGLLNDSEGAQSLEFQEDQWNFWQTLFHPNFLGLALVLLLALFTVKYMSSSQ